MGNIALIVNTVDKNKDIWTMFFDQLEAFLPQEICSTKYVFVNETTESLPSGYRILYFDGNEIYRQQFTSCISEVSEEYCIYISEDYILYDEVCTDLIGRYTNILEENKDLSFIRFMKGGIVEGTPPNYRNYPDLFQMHHSMPYFYTNQAALWRTRDLEKIHIHGPNLHIANKDWENSFEYQATATCQQLDIQGVYCYHGEAKAGQYHYDSVVFPHIATALIKGKWNLSEYPERMKLLLEKYDIDVTVRGYV